MIFLKTLNSSSFLNKVLKFLLSKISFTGAKGFEFIYQMTQLPTNNIRSSVFCELYYSAYFSSWNESQCLYLGHVFLRKWGKQVIFSPCSIGCLLLLKFSTKNKKEGRRGRRKKITSEKWKGDENVLVCLPI